MAAGAARARVDGAEDVVLDDALFSRIQAIGWPTGALMVLGLNFNSEAVTVTNVEMFAGTAAAGLTAAGAGVDWRRGRFDNGDEVVR